MGKWECVYEWIYNIPNVCMLSECVCVYRYRYVNKFMLVERITIIMLQIQDVMANRLPKRMASWLFFSIFFFFFFTFMLNMKNPWSSSSLYILLHFVHILYHFFLVLLLAAVLLCIFLFLLAFSYHFSFDYVYWSEVHAHWIWVYAFGSVCVKQIAMKWEK
jgi:hypothetical protein